MIISNDDELTKLKEIGRICANALQAMAAALEPGITTLELDAIGRKVLEDSGARSAPEFVYKFPGATCISVNEEIAHGIPGPRVIRPGEIVLIDLWAKEGETGVYADQTWMASIGKPSEEASEIWKAVRDARDAAIDLVRNRAKAHTPVRGADVDDASRQVIESRGYGEYFTHRTGHSIDPRDLHGSGPHLDNLETREERLLVPGVAFSIEPGIYIAGKIGMRSEVNVYMTPGEAVVTPREYQTDLLIV